MDIDSIEHAFLVSVPEQRGWLRMVLEELAVNMSLTPETCKYFILLFSNSGLQNMFQNCSSFL